MRYAVVDTGTNLVISIIDEAPEFDVSPYIKVASELAEVGWQYDPIGEIVHPDVTGQLFLIRNIESATLIEAAGYSFQCGIYQTLVPYVAQAQVEDPGDSRVIFFMDEYVTITNEDLLTIYKAALDFESAYFYARVTCEEAIENETLTDWAEVQTAWDTAFAAAPTRDVI